MKKLIKKFIRSIILKIFFNRVVVYEFCKIISEYIVDNNETLLSHHMRFNDKSSKKGIVYTCITGNYDNLTMHHYIDNDYDYVCFTDNEKLLKLAKYGVWKIKPLQFSELDNTRNARWHKTHPHILFSNYDYSLWVDANVDILDDYIFNVVLSVERPLIIPLHNVRDCVYEEIELLKELPQKESIDTIVRMQKYLLEHNMPTHYGLNETNIVFRRHSNPLIIKIMEEWWHFISEVSKRDQLSLPFVLWRNNIKPFDISIPNARRSKNFFMNDSHELLLYNSKIFEYNSNLKVWESKH